jgi:CheY-like chemotaxis protein
MAAPGPLPHLAVVPQFESADLPPDVLANLVSLTRAQVERLAGLVEQVAGDPDDRAALDAVRREAHKVRGSGAAIGFPAVTAIAGELEDAVRQWLAGPPAPAAAVATLRQGIAALRTALPADEGTDPPTAAPAPPVAPAGVPEVIVVEDDPTLVELLCYGLESQQYRFVAYRNGREALEQILALDAGDAHPVVLLDVDLPGIDGYAFVEALEARRPGVYRTVFLTVHGSEEEQLRGLEAGAVDYLVKPVMLRVLLEKVRRWVGR